jgi:23S rRNA (cytidine2498-2'-O)-methyltransferase
VTGLPGLVYEAVPGFEDHLEAELAAASGSNAADFSNIPETVIPVPEGGPFCRYGPALYRAPALSAASPVFWYRNAWLKPFTLEFSSIAEAARALRNIQRNWASVPFTRFRRAALIQEKLPPLPRRKRTFPWQVPAAPMGAWTLLDDHRLIASALCSSPFPGGVIEFEEDKNGPPSRAYLKLWEALTLAAFWGTPPPGPGSRCLDAGASPGGWTWALLRLGAEPAAVDRAPLDERVAAMPALRFIRHDAFTLKPEDLGPLDWLFCDAAVYPPRLYRWIETWLASGLCKNYMCTIKMQGVLRPGVTQSGGSGAGVPDFDTPRRFAAIPGSRVVHLYHNKHELCWIKCT